MYEIPHIDPERRVDYFYSHGEPKCILLNKFYAAIQLLPVSVISNRQRRMLPEHFAIEVCPTLLEFYLHVVHRLNIIQQLYGSKMLNLNVKLCTRSDATLVLRLCNFVGMKPDRFGASIKIGGRLVIAFSCYGSAAQNLCSRS